VLINAYGEEKGGIILHDAEKILYTEYSRINDRGSKAVRLHKKKYIFPSYVCYTAMIKAGIPQTEASNLAKEQLCKYSDRSVRFFKKLSNKSYAYKFIRTILNFALKLMFPKQGWSIEKVENSKFCYKFNMKSCLYLEELTELGVPELCAIFCYTDVVNFTQLSPAVIFTRKNTLADGSNKCDFCFEKGTV